VRNPRVGCYYIHRIGKVGNRNLGCYAVLCYIWMWMWILGVGADLSVGWLWMNSICCGCFDGGCGGCVMGGMGDVCCRVEIELAKLSMLAEDVGYLVPDFHNTNNEHANTHIEDSYIHDLFKYTVDFGYRCYATACGFRI